MAQPVWATAQLRVDITGRRDGLTDEEVPTCGQRQRANVTSPGCGVNIDNTTSEVPARECLLICQRRGGRRSLLIGATADHIVGMQSGESRALLDALLGWATQDRFCHTHDWAVGDVVIWDNTGILHRALPCDLSSRRTLQRTTIAGDEVCA